MASHGSGNRQENRQRNRAQEGQKLLRELFRLLLRLTLIALVVLILFSQVFMLCRMGGTDMFPACKDGDLLLAYRLQKDYRKNDVVIYRMEGIRRVGRVIARAGDNVVITEDGTIRVNGTVQRGEILYPTMPRSGKEETLTVPRNSVYILGDFRTACRDSRDFGPVANKQVEAKLITLLRRRGI